MGKLNVEGMAALKVERDKQKERLNSLISGHFDINNAEQMRQLKGYIDDFEYNVNLMYVYQALSNGLKAWGSSCIIALFLPIPDFINPILSACLYFGIAGFILERYSVSDFGNQLIEMEKLYNWCLKNGNPKYDDHLDNTAKLLNPDIQKMIQLMAPLCPTEFMIAWPKETERAHESSHYLSSAFSMGYSLISSPFSLFSSASRPDGNQQIALRDLKISVETRSLDRSSYTGFKQAIDYFMTTMANTDYKALLWSKWDDLKTVAPEPVAHLLNTHKMS
ncbi:hypothetical protein [Legionella worsleiensis]|uniref:Phosphatase n=1 Tax=Legionella worsleiensis TaxID=45076 RepID=A0A0W1A6J3_9GAMM|nr:hypothetical protein [Legionella worsleiensis]KTD76905.1 phosphatase [Legionella worsleiensis]STY33425.1 phosphatase [Legionella worsleiensis]